MVIFISSIIILIALHLTSFKMTGYLENFGGSKNYYPGPLPMGFQLKASKTVQISNILFTTTAMQAHYSCNDFDNLA